LASVEPGWGATHLDQALVQAADVLAESSEEATPVARQIVVISDLQEGSRLEGLQGHDWPHGVEVRLEMVNPKTPGNAGLTVVADPGDRPSASDAEVRVRVENSADARREQFRVAWLGAKGVPLSSAPVEVHVPAGQTRVVRMALPPNGAKAEGIGLQGDEETFDNTVYLVPPEPVESRVLYLGSEAATDAKQPGYFLERAYQETRRQAVRVESRDPGLALPAGTIDSASLVVITRALTEAGGQALRQTVEGGKTVVVAPVDREAAVALSRSLGFEVLVWEEAPSSRYGLLGEIDFRHPLLATFADARFSDFTKIHFWRHRRVDTAGVPDARVLARFDNGDPAWFEIPLGKVLVLTSGWHPADSQLALSTKFVPLVYAMLEYAGAGYIAAQQTQTGDVLKAPVAGRDAAGARWTGPDGEALDPGPDPGVALVAGRPGIYGFAGGNRVSSLAVNLDPAESRTVPLGEDQFQAVGVPLTAVKPPDTVADSRTARLNSAELEGRQKLWWWFLTGTVAVVLAETWLAGRAARLAGIFQASGVNRRSSKPEGEPYAG
jgi:hypothetical protein